MDSCNLPHEGVFHLAGKTFLICHQIKNMDIYFLFHQCAAQMVCKNARQRPVQLKVCQVWIYLMHWVFPNELNILKLV